MLVLSRKPGQKIHIGDNITVTIVEIQGNRVRLALEAPNDVRILRAELTPEARPVVVWTDREEAMAH
jgi:carbon storage regulator